MGRINIEYNGLEFYVASSEGKVYINNIEASVNQVLPGSCVITIGDPKYGPHRRFVTFDISNPEVIL